MIKLNTCFTTIVAVILSLMALDCYSQTQSTKNEKKEMMDIARYMAKNKNEQVACQLTSSELRTRKETIIASMKKQMLDKKS